MRNINPEQKQDSVALGADSACLFFGKVMHQRMKPKAHRFSYDVFNVLLDVDDLPAIGRRSPFFSVGRFNLVSFSQKDHGPRDGSSLRDHIDGLLDAKGVERPERVMLLAYPRILGYVFNPLSVYYCYNADNRVTALVYEVRNTFGDLHTYVCPVQDSERSEAGIRQTQSKDFYVSPFIDMEQNYHFRMVPPNDGVRVRILETDADGPLLSATFSGERLPFTSSNLLRLFFKVPLLTLKVMAAIHWEAFKLWRKRLKFHSRNQIAASSPAAGKATNSQMMTG
jgi:hypothetical protein